MTEDAAKYLSGVAENVGVINWAIVDYRPDGSLEHVRGFRFEGVGNLPRLRDRVARGLWQRFTVEIRGDVVYVY